MQLFVTFVGFLCVCFAVPTSAKLGETEPQLVKRFGNSYTVEPTQIGKTYKFRSANFSVDVVVVNGFSVAETYLSDHPLTTSGEPPNDIVQAVLRTNAPKARWVEIEAAPFGADYALRSSDGEYIAILKYSGAQPENSIWIMTVGLAKSVRAVVTPAPSTNPSSPTSTIEPVSSPFPTASPSALANTSNHHSVLIFLLIVVFIIGLVSKVFGGISESPQKTGRGGCAWILIIAAGIILAIVAISFF